MLWEKIPDAYRTGLCYTDLYESYKRVLPTEQHRPCTKKEGQTNHHPEGTRRCNLTLRQSVGRLVRKALSFSKKLRPHIYALRLFFVTYNKRAAKRYQTNRTPITPL